MRNVRRAKEIVIRLILILFVSLLQDGSLPVKAAEREAAGGYCPLGNAVATDGYRRLALIVGVGQYKSDQVADLPGPSGDARRIYELLTGKNGYGFPKENLCMLLDEEATTVAFKQHFAQALIDRAQANERRRLLLRGSRLADQGQKSR